MVLIYPENLLPDTGYAPESISFIHKRRNVNSMDDEEEREREKVERRRD
jgi:hypothetical protein